MATVGARSANAHRCIPGVREARNEVRDRESLLVLHESGPRSFSPFIILPLSPSPSLSFSFSLSPSLSPSPLSLPFAHVSISNGAPECRTPSRPPNPFFFHYPSFNPTGTHPLNTPRAFYSAPYHLFVLGASICGVAADYSRSRHLLSHRRRVFRETRFSAIHSTAVICAVEIKV